MSDLTASCRTCADPGDVYVRGVLYCAKCAVRHQGTHRSDSGSTLTALNLTTVDGLVQLAGVGPVLAGRIATHRERNGPFERLEDLLNVAGIGEIRLAMLRAALDVDPVPATGFSATRYERKSAHLPALGESARDFYADAPRIRTNPRRRSRSSPRQTKHSHQPRHPDGTRT